jgi:tungstate transport system ATP-binding protein
MDPAEGREAMIRIRDLLVRRRNIEALRIRSMDIRRGETLAVVGPNGSGKSTFLLTLAHLLEPVRGSLAFEDRPLADWDDIAYRRQIAFVFQDPLLMDMTVRDNIALGLRFRGIDREEVRERVERWSRALGVHPLLERRAGRLSGGEAQRVSLARAFVLEPQLLLMDEPFSALDPPTRARMLADLSKLLAGDHRTAIIVTHDLNEAARLGDRVAVMIGGQLKQVGTPKQIKARPADDSVRAFLRGLPD